MLHDVDARSPLPPPHTAARAPYETDANRYEAIRRRAADAEGVFWYAVLTTGVYCRPSCAARLPRPENVTFYATRRAAEQAGYRPCKRCRPEGPPAHARHAELVREVRAHIEAADTSPSLEALAKRANVSAAHLHRLFKAHVGLTPREYGAAHRLGRMGTALAEGASVTTAIYEAGYGSSSRFYEKDSKALGAAAGALRRGGAGLTIRALVRACSLGRMLVAATPRGICAVAFGDDDDRLRKGLQARFPHATIAPEDEALEALAAKAAAMVDQGTVAPDLPLDLLGTAFQQRVWRALRELPPGATATYGEVARRIGAPEAARAVGTACGKNPVAVLVPCHRVVREDGGLGGYAWGLERKKKLLEHEREQEGE